ncbi:MAG: phosphatase PAP2 family protein [Candidatus Cloacimonetes bacterium]|nr:phosphatase PAP2 family protein [Candidatus Cloacimonadota bacterium]
MKQFIGLFLVLFMCFSLFADDYDLLGIDKRHSEFIEYPFFLQNAYRYTKLDNMSGRLEIGPQLAIGSVLVTSFLIDQSVRDYFQDKVYGGHNVFTDVLKGVGERDVLFYILMVERQASLLLPERYPNDTFFLSIQSMLTTQAITQIVKSTAKRSRPRHSPDDPFNFGGKGDSFFSGHSSGVWSYTTVVATRHPEVSFFAYSFASLVSISRIYEDAHWTSDVLTGAIVGYHIGRLTANLNKPYVHDIYVIPYLHEKEKWVLFQYRF